MRFLLKKSTWRTFASVVSAIATLLIMVSFSYTWYKDRDADEYRRSMEFFNLIRIKGDKLNEDLDRIIEASKESKVEFHDIKVFFIAVTNFVAAILWVQAHIKHQDVISFFKAYMRTSCFNQDLTIKVMMPYLTHEDLPNDPILDEWSKFYENVFKTDNEQKENIEIIKTLYQKYLPNIYKRYFPK